MSTCVGRVYQNSGNARLLQLLSSLSPQEALDCGCGAGDNARVLTSWGWKVTGITISPDEYAAAAPFCQYVYLSDLENGLPQSVLGPYRLVLISHVLEHLVHPEKLLHDVRRLLTPDGILAVALPNVVFWKHRVAFLLGRFEYTPNGIMDDTHVRFYTLKTGFDLLYTNGFDVIYRAGDGHFPLPWVRSLLPALSSSVDRLMASWFPGLFGWQSLYLANIRGPSR